MTDETFGGILIPLNNQNQIIDIILALMKWQQFGFEKIENEKENNKDNSKDNNNDNDSKINLRFCIIVETEGNDNIQKLICNNIRNRLKCQSSIMIYCVPSWKKKFIQKWSKNVNNVKSVIKSQTVIKFIQNHGSWLHG